MRVLRTYRILDTPPEEAFDAITRVAAHVADVPIALISLIDEDRQWFKSRHGLAVSETPRAVAFCDHAIRERSPIVVSDVRDDPRFADNPLVTEAPHVRFYAGAPLISPEGAALGTLCLIDQRPRNLTAAQREVLLLLAKHVEAELEVRRLARRHAQEQARAVEANRVLRHIIDHAPVMMFLKKPDSLEVTLWNREAERITGVSKAEILGKTGFETFPQEEMQEFQERDRRVVRDRRMVEAEETVTGPNGPRTLRTKKVPVLNDEGKASHLLGISEDVTELRAREAEIAELLQTLEQSVDQRTNRLREVEARLHVAQKLEGLGRLAGGVAHDFNNLLTVILGYSQAILEQSSLDAEDREDLAEVVQAGERAAALTRQLLAFGRRQMLAPEVLDLSEVVAEMESMLVRLVGDSVELSITSQPSLGKVEADRSQIEQVIMNLVINARDAMPEGGRVAIDLRNDRAAIDSGAESPDVAVVRVSVRDTGTGMNADTLARIFEPFFTTKAEDRGTGLGLPTVYGIAAQSGGRVTVDSAPGVGSCFTVVLPRAQRASVPPRPASGGEWKSHPAAGRVLVVDDDPLVLRFISRTLRRRGYDVIEAASAGDALLACETQLDQVDLLVCDVSMPRMNGVELASRLRTRRPSLPVLYVTGYAGEGVGAPEGERLLPKPLTAPELLGAVGECLADR